MAMVDPGWYQLTTKAVREAALLQAHFQFAPVITMPMSKTKPVQGSGTTT